MTDNFSEEIQKSIQEYHSTENERQLKREAELKKINDRHRAFIDDYMELYIRKITKQIASKGCYIDLTIDEKQRAIFQCNSDYILEKYKLYARRDGFGFQVSRPQP